MLLTKLVTATSACITHWLAVCPPPPGCDVGALVVVDGPEVAWGDLLPPFPLAPNTIIRVATNAMTPSTARTATMIQGAFEPGPLGGGPGGNGPPGQPGGICWP